MRQSQDEWHQAASISIRIHAGFGFHGPPPNAACRHGEALWYSSRDHRCVPFLLSFFATTIWDNNAFKLRLGLMPWLSSMQTVLCVLNGCAGERNERVDQIEEDLQDCRTIFHEQVNLQIIVPLQFTEPASWDMYVLHQFGTVLRAVLLMI